ncbi:TonB-dependent receptor [Rhodocytophaga aerolata]|uniref:TonB-dependent receptor n=1 Tax=Rhodocytophaga aerolata TaxID=455078 RepID=A0ABT8R4Q5_9BACT|nr:TonB-dependent receptor [Rhodocytophaga aerolata]MDO1447077.1 TonB-dependent receptor [Rhodocytophaga aerolata]
MVKNMYQNKDNLRKALVLQLSHVWKFTTLLLVILFLHSYTSQAQSRLAGKVTSTLDNQPIPGVNIVIKGSTTGTTTDGNGDFSIETKSGDVLVVSFIGYQTEEVAVTNQTRLDIQLAEDITTLGEVVVVGYGELKRTDITSAQTTISAKEIQSTVNTTIEQAIQGRTAGVYVTQNTGQPGGGISVNIRGINSINGSNEPLYVIDGVQIAPPTVQYGARSSTNPLAGLNPSDIESMEILQGPSATAIYGSRGTNGVVLITTKRGKAGQMNINYGYTFSLQDKPEFLSTMDLQQYATMHNAIRTLTGGTLTTEFQDPSILGKGTNWQDALFKRAPLHKHQLSLSGGSEKTTFYLSGEYFDQEGVATGSAFDRYSVRLNVDNQTRKWLKIGTNLNFSQTNEELGTSQSDVIINALQMAPNIAVVNPNGTWGGADATNGSSTQFTPPNPIALAELIQNNFKRRNFLGGVNADVTILKGLTFRTSFNGNIGFNNSVFFTPTYQLGSVVNSTASLERRNETNTYWNWNQLLQYTNRFGKHDINLMASHESQESLWENIYGSRTGFVSNDLIELTLGNPLGQQNGSARGQWAMESYLGRAVYSFADKYIVQGAFRADGSANFGPENRWGFFPSVSVAWRVTQEPFMEAMPFINELKLRAETGLTGNQGDGGRIFSPLGAVTTPWGSGFRASRYGNAGLQWEETQTNNIGFNLSILNSRVQVEGDFYVKNTDNLLMENPLPWYMGTSAEGSIAPPTVNIGALQNKGYAFTLNTINVDNGQVNWTTNFNVSGFRTKVTEFYSEAAFLDRTSWWMSNWTQRAVVGQAPWLMRGYVAEGLFQSVEEINASAIPTRNGERLPVDPSGVWVGDIKYKDLNGDNVIDERDQTFIGNPWPKVTLGLTNTVSYKGFELTALLTGAFGNDVYNYIRFVNTNPNQINLGRNMLAETFDYAKVEGEGTSAYISNPGTTVPRITSTDANGNGVRHSSKFIEDGSYVRVKNLQLSYNLPKSLLGVQNVVQGARVSFGIQNLATFTKYKGMDPEVGAYVGNNVSATTQSIGLDYGRYPLTRMYTFNIGIDF